MKNKILLTFSFVILCAFSSLVAQVSINGNITDESGIPLIGANVLEKNTTNGTITDIDGNFTLNVASSESIVVISYTGFASKEMAVGDQRNFTFKLAEDTVLDEVLIVGYGETDARFNVQSVTQLGSKAVEAIPAVSPQQILQGQVAGVQMTNSSGVLGAASSVRIRGVASLNAGGSPLYVVDGVPLNDETRSLGSGGARLNPLLNLNPSEIESMTVLKDASATAIYGSRGSNGVVLITTKKGTAGKNNVIFNLTTGTLKPTNTFDFMNAAQYQEIRGIETPIESEFDWPTAVLQTGKTLDASIGFQGGNETTTYYVGGFYSNASNYTIGNDINQMGGRLNFTHKLSDKLRVGTNLSLSRAQSDRTNTENSTFAPLTSSYLQDPRVDAFNEDGTYANTGFIANVIAIEELGLTELNSYRATGNMYFSYDIIDNLTFKTDLGLDFVETQEEQRYVEVIEPGGSTYNELNKDVKWLTTNTLNYGKYLTDDHYLGVTVGQSYEESQFSDIIVAGTGFAADKLRNAASAATPTTTSASRSKWGLFSYFMRADYRFQDKYLFQSSFRRDGSSRFGIDNRWGTFWSVGAGWIVSAEDFLFDNSTVNFLKLKVSYGKTGNDRIGRFASLGLAGGGNDYNGNPGLAASQAANPDLKWEESTMLDIGFESQLFNNLLDLDVSYYIKNTDDMLLNFPLPEVSGFSDITRNAGSMKNTGIDIQGALHPISTEDFSWDINFNIGFLNNEITSLPDASEDPLGNKFIEGSASQRAVEGQSANEFYLIRYSGIDPATGDAYWFTKDGELTTAPTGEDRVYVGSAIPDFTGGFGTSLRWKDIDLSGLFQFVSGSKIFLGELRFTENIASGFNKTTNLLDYWKEPGDESFAPSLESATAGTFAQRSTLQMFNGSYLRLKNVSLGYNLSGSTLSTNAFESVRVWVRGTNLLTFNADSFRGQDIEVSANGQSNAVQGESFFATPQAKRLEFGLSATF